jgi:hypothetical protein
MEDVPDAPGRDHHMTSFKSTVKGSVMSGHVYGANYSRWPSRLDAGNYTYPSIEFSSSAASVYSRMVAGTAPHRAEFGVPTFLAELKDIPGLIKDGFRFSRWVLNHTDAWFDPDRKRWKKPSKPLNPQRVLEAFGYAQKNSVLYAKRLANASLAIQFGFTPFLSDIVKAAELIGQIDRRRDELSRVRDNGVLKRRWKSVERLDGPAHVIDHRSIAPEGEHSVDVTISQSGRRWATVKWFPTPNTLLPKSDAELVALMLGLNAGGMLQSAWEAMPWSWLIDYFTNVGDIIARTANGAQYECTGCVMSEIQLKASHPSHIVDKGDYFRSSLSAGELVKTHFWRESFDGTAGIIVFGDILRPKQLSILASLAAVKA